MKTNLKLTKITISKLDNLNLKSIPNEELKNLKGGQDVLTWNTIDIVTIGGTWNDTSSYTSCVFSEAGNCLTRLS